MPPLDTEELGSLESYGAGQLADLCPVIKRLMRERLRSIRVLRARAEAGALARSQNRAADANTTPENRDAGKKEK